MKKTVDNEEVLKSNVKKHYHYAKKILIYWVKTKKEYPVVYDD